MPVDHAKNVADFLEEEEEMNGDINTTRVAPTGGDVEKQETEKFMDEPLEDNNDDAKDGVVRKQAGQGKPLRLPLGSVSERKQKKAPKRKRPAPTSTSSLVTEEEEDTPLATRILVVLGFILVLACGIVLLTRDPKHADDNEPEFKASDYENQPGTGGQTDLFD